MTSEFRTAVAKPLYGQVREMILGRIGKGEWRPGEALPNEFELSGQFDVSIGTIRRAIAGLEDAGIVVRKQGRGTFISGEGAQALQSRFTSIRSTNGRPLQLTYDLLTVERRPLTAAERARLIAAPDEPVFHVVQRLRTALSVVGREHSVIPVRVHPDLATRLGTGQPLYSILSEHGVLVTRTEDQIRVGSASDVVAADVGVAAGTAIMLVERLAFGIDPKPIEFRMASYLPNVVSHIAVT